VDDDADHEVGASRLRAVGFFVSSLVVVSMSVRATLELAIDRPSAAPPGRRENHQSVAVPDASWHPMSVTAATAAAALMATPAAAATTATAAALRTTTAAALRTTTAAEAAAAEATAASMVRTTAALATTALAAIAGPSSVAAVLRSAAALIAASSVCAVVAASAVTGVGIAHVSGRNRARGSGARVADVDLRSIDTSDHEGSPIDAHRGPARIDVVGAVPDVSVPPPIRAARIEDGLVVVVDDVDPR